MSSVTVISSGNPAMRGQSVSDSGSEKIVKFAWIFFLWSFMFVAEEYEDMNRKELLWTISNLEKVGTPLLFFFKQ